MHTIAVYAESLAIYTSSTPSREMLRKLVEHREGDQFLFLFRKGGEKAPWVEEYLATLPENRVKVEVLRWSRRSANLRALFGLKNFEQDLPRADLYLDFHVGGLGEGGLPLIDLIADLSVLDSKKGSMPWHGRILSKRALNRTLNQSTNTVVISEATAKGVEKFAPRAKTQLSVIPNGIADLWHTRGREDISELGDYLIWYGQVTPRKNLNSLIGAYASILEKTELPKLKLISQKTRGCLELETKVKEMGLDQMVIFEEPMALVDLIDEVRRSRGLVFPSYNEGFGMPIAEAMACGRPVVTSNTTSMPEVAGGLAEICDPYRQESIEDGIAAILDLQQDTPVRRQERRVHAGRYTALNAAKLYGDLIDQVLSKDGE